MLSTAGEILVYLNNPLTNALTNALASPILRTRVAWPFLARPVKSWEFPADQERLVTPDELMRFGFWGSAESA